MLIDKTPHGMRREYEVNKKDRLAAKGASPKEKEHRRLTKKLRKLKKK
ncbi:hypothetical protein [Enterococcus sp. DIV0098]